MNRVKEFRKELGISQLQIDLNSLFWEDDF